MTPPTVAHQAPVSMGFPRQEYWSGLTYPLPGDLSNPGIKPPSLLSPALAGIFLAGTLSLCHLGRSFIFSQAPRTVSDIVISQKMYFLIQASQGIPTSCFSQAQRHHAYLKPLNSKFRTIEMLTFTPPLQILTDSYNFQGKMKTLNKRATKAITLS